MYIPLTMRMLRVSFETDFTYCDALKMADRLTFFRFMVKELAREEGYFASFMPKPFANQTGSGAHYNMSLADLETGKNLFEDASDPRGLSKLGYQFIAGCAEACEGDCIGDVPNGE